MVIAITSEFYLARAAESARDARATALPRVRERCLRAEAAWLEMADRLLKREAERDRQAGERNAGLVERQ